QSWLLSLLLLQTGVQGFMVLIAGRSMDHLEITRAAILQTTAQVCKPLTVEALSLACSSSWSAKSFQSAISDVTWRNAGVDFRHLFNEKYHFDGERFVEGRKLITDGMTSVKASIKQVNFEAARQKLGVILHNLQVILSRLGHSVLCFRYIFWSGQDKDTPTCQSCVGNNIPGNIIRDHFYIFLTFIYLGKSCSHGGSSDQTRRQEPTGGINKDSLESNHGNWHTAAAEVAVAATSQLLEDIRGAARDTDFLNHMRTPSSTRVSAFSNVFLSSL
uniref:VWA7 N-terminal domain-containing protein n=1 Tax=Oncorhynchus tshawytscha TaxID=74940 RepID=A0AAZ3Q054_ONCTS